MPKSKLVWDQSVKIIKKPSNWFYETCEDPTGLIGRIGFYHYTNEQGQKASDTKTLVVKLSKYELGHRYMSIRAGRDYSSLSTDDLAERIASNKEVDEILRELREDQFKRDFEQFIIPRDHLEGYVQPLPHGTKVRIIGDHPNWPRHTSAYPEIGIKCVVAHRRAHEVMTPPWGAVTVKIKAKDLGYMGDEPIYYHLLPECLEVISK
jgi:hypothetical protein